ncbi:MAG: retropepsin-like domain-containing protein [Deltaproteobacteria bacterium]|jgi:hypothetical protein|nr:retropepsin-like domain-containing protein [Deltaproteobacteria bacterium]
MTKHLQLHSFTYEADRVALELVTPVGIGLPVSVNSFAAVPDINNLKAIWDTGATGCAITIDVAQKIKAPVINQVLVGGVHGKERCNQYLISLFLPNHVYIPGIPVTELSQEAGCDLLIGMDVISLGDFSTSTLGGKTSFTFRIPSYQKQDFSRYMPKDNSVCVCGSGNMFKNCCKKQIGTRKSV